MVKKLKLLLLDCDYENKHWVSNALKEIAVDFIEVDSIAAIEKISPTDFDLILLGLDLPDCKGIACLEKVKRIFPTKGVIVVVSAGEEKPVMESVKFGAQGFIQVGTLGSKSIGTLIELAYNRQTAINQINESKNQLSNLISNLPGFIYRCLNDQYWTMKYLSNGVEELTGYTPEDIVDNKKISYLEIIHPDDRQKVDNESQDAVTEKRRYQLEYRIVTADKVVKWVWEQGNAVYEKGKVSYFEGYIIDITDPKMRELQMQAIIDIGEVFRNNHRLEEFCPKFIGELQRILKTDCVALMLPTNREDTVLIEFAVGSWQSKIGEEIDLTICLSHPALKKSKYILYDNENPGITLCETLKQDASPNMAFLPLPIEKKQTALLILGRKSSFSEREMEMLIALTDMLVPAIERSNLNKKTEEQLRHLESLHVIDQAITSNFDIKVVNKIILDQVCKELEGDAADILILNPATNLLENAGAMGFMDPMIRNIRVPLTTSVAGKVLLENKEYTIFDLEANPLWVDRPKMKVENFKAYFARPMSVKGETVGVLEVFMRKKFYPDRGWSNFLESLATQAAVAYDSFMRYTELQRMQQSSSLSFRNTLESWSKSLELHDMESEGHIRRVTSETLQLAQELGVSDDDLPNIERGALLHDIGKIGIMDSILQKKGTLTDDEWAQIKRHPQIARDLLSNVKMLQDSLDIPYSHHENWDGSGYPQGLKGEEIPLPARIFAVVDTYDALISERPYRHAWEKSEAVNYLIDQKGKKFDPKIVDLFVKSLA